MTRSGTRAGAAALATAVAGAAYVVTYGQTPAPHLHHDSVLDAVFDSRALVAGARLVIAVVMIYVLVSVGVRVWRNQWVRGAGPLETDAPTRELASDADELRRQMRGAQSEIESLGARLRESLAARDELRATVERLQGTGGGDDRGP